MNRHSSRTRARQKKRARITPHFSFPRGPAWPHRRTARRFTRLSRRTGFVVARSRHRVRREQRDHDREHHRTADDTARPPLPFPFIRNPRPLFFRQQSDQHRGQQQRRQPRHMQRPQPLAQRAQHRHAQQRARHHHRERHAVAAQRLPRPRESRYEIHVFLKCSDPLAVKG